MKKQLILASLLVGLAASGASASLVISEWMYQGANGEFVELTNTGPGSIDMTGWSYDDNTDTCGMVDLSAFGTIAPGQSVVFTESDAAAFITAWNLAGVSVIGSVTDNLSRNDAINVFDAGCNLVDRLQYGDQDFIGSIRTQNRSGNPLSAGSLGANNPFLWELATNGDVHGSYFSAGSDQGNPGLLVIPEPSAMALLALAAIGLIRRR